MTTNNAVNVGLSGQSGTGNFAGTTSPTFVTPVLGTPTSGTLTNCTGLPVGTGLATATNSSVLVAGSTGTPVWSSTMTNGQVIIGSTSATPTAATLTAGTGVSITNGAASITISSSGSAGWVDQTTSSVTMAVNTGYTSDAGASLVTFTLPASATIGDFIEINGKGSGLWTIAQGSGQQIRYGNLSTTVGATGTLSSTLQFDNVRLRCITTNTTFTVVSSQGNLTVV